MYLARVICDLLYENRINYQSALQASNKFLSFLSFQHIMKIQSFLVILICDTSILHEDKEVKQWKEVGWLLTFHEFTDNY